MKSLEIAAIFAGAVLGAGFASGQEIMLYFAKYSFPGTVGVIGAGLLFAFFGALVLGKAFQLKEKTVDSYLNSLLPKTVAKMLSVTILTFVGIGFAIMISGSGETMKQALNTSPAVGVAVTLLLCYIVFVKNVSGLSLLNSILVPIMVVCMIFVSIYTIITETIATISGTFIDTVPIQTFLYVGFNMLVSTAVLVPCAAIADTKKQAVAGGIIGGLVLLIVAFFITLSLTLCHSHVIEEELPLLIMSGRLNKTAYYLYAFVLYLAMLTTATASGFPIVEKLTQIGVGRRLASILVCLGSLPFLLFRFSSLVSTFFTIFGYLGLILLIGIFFDFIKNIVFLRKSKK